MRYVEALRQKANLGKVKGMSLTSKGAVLEKNVFSSGVNKILRLVLLCFKFSLTLLV